ncbi:MAG: hypothetical protein L6R36_007908 [Xanthoria steineri]|nr:MAG: hypothetical protein L6R36_007908 [Xanthoria steineri]
MIMSPTLATQATQTATEIACERPPRLDQFFTNLFDLPEKRWKSWRQVFNKGFSADNLASFVPGMVEETLQYRQTLKKYAQSGELVRLDLVTLRFTIDFIGRTVLSVIDLVLQAYLDDDSATNRSCGKRDATELDAGIRAFAISQVRLFLFVGHDSMSSTICYALHLLFFNPGTLSQVRSEHDTVL